MDRARLHREMEKLNVEIGAEEQTKEAQRVRFVEDIAEQVGEFTNVKQLFRQRFDACVNKMLFE
jgi:hypothetical protein